MEEKMKRVTMLLAAGFVLLAAASQPIMRADAQQTVVTDNNLSQMITSAKTPANHEAIAAYYDTEAAENEKKARLHELNKNMYSKADFSAHCNALIGAYHNAAKEDKALAADHRKMAKKAGAGA
jgi:hypothetical protein